MDSDCERRCSYCNAAPRTPGQEFCRLCLSFFDGHYHSDTAEMETPPINPTSWGSRGDYSFINVGKGAA